MRPSRIPRDSAEMAAQSDKLDVVIFGATGYTGKVAVIEAVKLMKEKGVTWGIAGRSQSKLEAVLKEVSEKTGKHSSDKSYLESMQLEYHDAASDKGVYIVGACGMDSIPTDMGVEFLKKQFPGDLNSVEVYLQMGQDNPVEGDSTFVNYGTYESAIYSVANYGELRPLRSKLFPNRLPAMQPKLQARSAAHKRDNMGWCVPFMGSDRSVIIRSQRHFFEIDKERPAQVQVYMVVKSFIAVAALALFGFVFLMLARFQFGRNILLKYPRFFTFGFLGSEGPKEEYRKSVKCRAKILVMDPPL
ncbi:hypothetical protein C0J52_00071 [Blattella germanica]|nr:hypothetical protein C0J52_00071 [Blattella germanica]